MADDSLLIILGNQLFHIEEIKKTGAKKIFMKEDLGLCTDFKHHKLKILFFLGAMREYRENLEANGFKVFYYDLETKEFNTPYLELLEKFIQDESIRKISYFEIEDKGFAEEFNKFISSNKIETQKIPSPMFLCERNEFEDFFEGKSLRMVSFYQMMRKKLDILMDQDKPVGGKWSFDDENRKKLPKDISVPDLPKFTHSAEIEKLKKQISMKFNSHYGELENIWFPFTRKDSLKWFDNFLSYRLNNFGTYEDALHTDHNFVFHSALSPLLNIGLLTPKEIIEKSIAFSIKNNVPLNSIEGFIRQIIGWREFIRGTYHLKGEEESKSNFFNHTNKLTKEWYTGETGIPPLDDAIKNCLKFGFTHHIPRLMIISNLMTLARVDPAEIYHWFMEMFIDSSEWVMTPNVFGMGTFADGGLFATKPYSCGSNYLLKMSNYKKGEWCDVVDGLYWKFMNDNLDFFKSNPRLSLIPRALDRMKNERKGIIFSKAESFINTFTK